MSRREQCPQSRCRIFGQQVSRPTDQPHLLLSFATPVMRNHDNTARHGEISGSVDRADVNGVGPTGATSIPLGAKTNGSHPGAGCSGKGVVGEGVADIYRKRESILAMDVTGGCAIAVFVVSLVATHGDIRWNDDAGVWKSTDVCHLHHQGDASHAVVGRPQRGRVCGAHDLGWDGVDNHDLDVIEI